MATEVPGSMTDGQDAGEMPAPDRLAPPQAFGLCVGDLLRKQASLRPLDVAIDCVEGQITFAALERRVNRLANALSALGVTRGARVAILAQNRLAYLELELAAAKLGAIVPCLNWRLAGEELAHCIALTTPAVLFVSDRFAGALESAGHRVPRVIRIEAEYEAMLAASTEEDTTVAVDPEDGLVILYTSGTTGFPKGALISHRAMIARAMAFYSEFGITAADGFVAWSPLFHMAATDFSLATLMMGGKVLLRDGLDVDDLCAVLEREPLGWLVAMPGMIQGLIEGLRRVRPRVRSLKLVGAMADLVPLHQIAELTTLLDAPYLNSFGSTETGLPPATAALIGIGETPSGLSKRESMLCRLRLVDPDDADVPPGTPGEAALRGPTLFSGYWNAPEVNAREFRGGWFHMGDMFVRNADGTLDFVDRLKYMIKSGGENVYPAEIERVLLAHEQVADAVVVRKRDQRWGEVPVAFVARRSAALTEAELSAACRAVLAGYKMPKEIRFVDVASLPRSSTGKIQRHEVEKWLVNGPPQVPQTARTPPMSTS